MVDEEDLARFIQQQRAKIAHDRDILKNNPASAITDNSVNRQYLKVDKENRVPQDSTLGAALPVSQHQHITQNEARPPSTPRIFRLGDDYKKKREKLKEELREDYRNAMAEKNLRTTGIRYQNQGSHRIQHENSDLGLSLPIKDRLSAKMKDDATETYEDLLSRKRVQEKSYRAVNDDQQDFREKSYPYDDGKEEDDGYYSQRRVRFPSKGRRSKPRSRKYYDDEFDDEEEERMYRSRNRRRGRGRRRRRITSSDEDDEEDESEEDVRPFRRRDAPRDRQKMTTAFEREATTGSLRLSKEKQEIDQLRSKSAPPEQEFTGLPIGSVTSANTTQRRKEEYRTQLLQQMEEKRMTKKKERELELQTDLKNIENEQARKREPKDTNTPPKRHAARSPPPADDEKRQRKGGKRSSVKYTIDSSSEEEGVARRTLPRGSFPRQYPYFNPQMQAPMGPNMGYFPPQYPSPYDEAYYYYGTRNPLDPPGVMPQAPPAMYQDGTSPLMAAMLSNRDNRVSFDEHERRKVEVGGVTTNTRHSINKNESSLIANEKRDEEKKKQQMQQYQEELKIQIEQKEREKRAAKEEQERYDLKMEKEARNYNPWGKGGGGAPMKDRKGNLISDLRQMHIENEEAGRDPTKAEEVVKERLPQTNLYRRDERPVIDLSPRQDGADDFDPNSTSPRFGRSNPFEMKQSDEQKAQRDVYKDYLEKQIEEKRKLEAEKRERERIEDEKEEKRLEEQRKKIQAELEAEEEKERNKKEMARLQNERLRIEAEERRKEEQRRKMEGEEELRRQKEEELNARLRVTTTSPPIPALQNQNTGRQAVQDTPRSPRDDGKLEKQAPVLQPVPQRPQNLTTYREESPAPQNRDKMRSRAESKRISRELSALRKQLLSEQRRVENQLQTVDTAVQPQNVKTEYLVDLSRARQKPVSVRRPPTVEKDRPSSKALKEFTDYKHRSDDTASIRMFRAEYPETPSDAKALERQQEALLERQGRNLENLRQQKNADQHSPRHRRTNQDHFGHRPPGTAQSQTSLLQADTSYIPVLPGDDDDDGAENRFHFDSNQSSPPQSRGSRRPSARERRRMAQKPPSAQSVKKIPPRARADNYSLNSLSSLATLDVDRLANKNHDRLEKLRAIQGDDVSLTDPDDILDRFVNKQKGQDGRRAARRPPTNDDGLGGRAGPSAFRDSDFADMQIQSFNTRPPSVNTVDTEPWVRPETGPTVA